MSEEDVGYLVRPIGYGEFEVTKWGMSNEPLSIYKVKRGNSRVWMCDSPGCRHSDKCKHARLVESWIRSGVDKHEMPVRMLKID